jgi:hypothetical protein
MAPRAALAALCVLVAVAAGCGGKSASTTTTAAAPATTTSASTTAPAGGAKSPHFTQAQWTAYQAEAKKFKQLNTSTLAKVERCVKPHNQSPSVLQACVGDSVKNLQAETGRLGTLLSGYAATVSGTCHTDLAALINYVVPYQASLMALQNTIDGANVGAAFNASSSVETARQGGQAKQAAVAQSCAPA